MRQELFQGIVKGCNDKGSPLCLFSRSSVICCSENCPTIEEGMETKGMVHCSWCLRKLTTREIEMNQKYCFKCTYGEISL